MSYSIRIRASAAKDLARINMPDRRRIAAAIDSLADEPLRGGLLKGDLRGLRRLRVGRYRVIYEVENDELIVLVVRISHRSEAYR